MPKHKITIPVEKLKTVERILELFQEEFESGQKPRIEDFLSQVPELREHILTELLAIEIHNKKTEKDLSQDWDYYQRFPNDRKSIDSVIKLASADPMDGDSIDYRVRIPTQEQIPETLGRFVIKRQLGKGGFGVVYLAHDPQLDRDVALKVLRGERFQSREQVGNFIEEARTAAKLNHPSLVAVHDVQTEEGLPFIVQEYIDGLNLGQWAEKMLPSYEQLGTMIAEIANALGYLHRKGLTHCDLKLANVLIDESDKPHVADFGLTIHESVKSLRKGEIIGTPSMMAPEQVRGESHYLDGRTDIWALGVMFYQLLVNQEPFKADKYVELFFSIQHQEPTPPTQIDANVPRDLERICLKCISKKRSDRYEVADDLRDDLLTWLNEKQATDTPQSNVVMREQNSTVIMVPPTKIVPKGLRSFDSKDADFFLELLPGPRDRDGLPESLRFWKNNIEQTDADQAFSVGLIYGPSGCGKSSLVKAGLLPGLAPHVLPIYIEATAEDTERRILAQLFKNLPQLPKDASLAEALAELRLNGAPGNRKVLLVIDQFEQWLHANAELTNCELLHALRHCEGHRLQTVLMIRDDFYLSVNRFFQELEISLIEGQNYSVVDLFDRQHARKVLTAFGQAYGKLGHKLKKEERQFIQQAVDELIEDNKIVSVRLALFADMMKTRPWIPSSLQEVGGIGGVGVTFLEETFSAKSAPPTRRVHQNAIREVLRALLPAVGTDIKGTMQPIEQLKKLSGYAQGQVEFNEVLHILDGEIRLITPTDPEGINSNDNDQSLPTKIGRKYYQLTHDYLVPALRNWLNQKQRETRRGRAKIRLEDRSAQWNATPENRYLPKLWEDINIRLLTQRRFWNKPQQNLMSRSGRLHGIRISIAIVVLSLSAWGGYEFNGRTKAQSLFDALVSSEAELVPEFADRAPNYQRWLTPLLSEAIESQGEQPTDIRKRINARIVMVVVDAHQIPDLLNDLLRDELHDSKYLGVICDSLRPYREQASARLWKTYRDERETVIRFRAGLALAQLDAKSKNWTREDAEFLVSTLLNANPEEQPKLRSYLTPIRTKVLPNLKLAFADSSASDRQRLGAATALSEFAQDDIQLIANLVSIATPEQFEVLMPLLEASKDNSILTQLRSIVGHRPETPLLQTQQLAGGRQKAGAAIALLHQGDRENLFDVFRVENDPESLTQFVHRCRDRDVTVEQLVECLEQADLIRRAKTGHQRKLDDQILFGLMLALGEYPRNEVPTKTLNELKDQLADWYANDRSSAIHGVSGWLLRHWEFDTLAENVDQTVVPYEEGREWFIKKIDAPATHFSEEKTAPNPYYFTFVVFEPGDYDIGSPDDEAGRINDESQRVVNLPRRFAVLDREITRKEFEAFGGYKMPIDEWSPPPGNHPVVGPAWYSCVEFCRTLSTSDGRNEEEQCYASAEELAAQGLRLELNPEFAQYPVNWRVEKDRPGFRLPTEAEWETMCRAGTASMFSFGNDQTLMDQYAWLKQNTNGQTEVPRKLRPNLRGIFDNHGNVAEWCHNWSSAYRDDETQDPFGPTNGESRVHRGGAWSYFANFSRSATRSQMPPGEHDISIGFRIICEVK